MIDSLRHSPRDSFRPLPFLLAMFVILALVYAWATPPLEASDELWHMGMVDTIADTGQLPVQQIGVETQWHQEGSQPPLYYLIAAALVQPVNRDDFDMRRVLNPHARAGVPGALDNRNLVLHPSPHPAPQGTALAVYALRVFGIVLGGVTVAAVYASALELSGSRNVAVLAAGLTAFNPMFLFISASVNNDTLVTALNSLVVWQMLVMMRHGFSIRRSLALVVLIALASLTKLSGNVLVPVVALAAVWTAREHRDWRGLVTLGGLMIVAWAGLAGWWYVRNLTLYGEFFGTRTMVAVAGARLEPFTVGTLISEFEGFRVGYWGWFGAVNIITHPLYYFVMDVLTLAALAGLATYLWRRRGQPQQMARVLALVLVLLIGSLALIQWTAQTYASQGRLLFPFIAATSPLLALGLDTLIAPLVKRARFVHTAFAVALALVALVIPFATIAPEYAPPPALAELPTSARPVYARFGDVALVGYQTPDARYAPGDSVPLTVYWQVIAQSERDLSLYLHAVNDAGEVIGRIDSFPGGGTLQTSSWQPGVLYADHYEIPLDPNAVVSSRLRVQVGWWHYESGEGVLPMSEDGVPLESVMLDAGGFVGDAPITGDFTPTERVSFGGVIALTGYQLDEDTLTLRWESTGTPAESYTVFAQVLDDATALVAQGDAPPSLPTRYWRAGDQFTTQHTLTYTQPPVPGTYRVLVGWYRPDDFARLETSSPDNAYALTTITSP